MTELMDTAAKIRRIFDAIADAALTEEELNQFAAHVSEQEAIYPLFDPTKYIKISPLLTKATERVELLRPIVERFSPMDEEK